MSYPIIKGVVVHDYNVDKIMKKHNELMKQKAVNDQKRNKLAAKKIWRQLIKKVVVRQYTAKLFDKDEHQNVLEVG